jgi:Predicted acetyltransferase
VTARAPSSVDLVAVDEAVLEQLVSAATSDADADEVTPRSTSGNTWSAARVAWLRNFHRARRLGLAGPAGEATWAIIADARVAGSVRLKRTDDPEVLETGVWLGRSARGRGVGRDALGIVLRKAAALGATAVLAETIESNVAALAVLEYAGFAISAADADGHVRAVLRLR